MKRIELAVIATIVLIAAGCGPQAVSFRQHPDMIEELKAKGRVTVLPADVAIIELDLYGDNQRLIDLETQLKNEVEQALTSRLTARGFEVKPALLQDEDVDGDGRVRFDFTRLQLDYSHLTFRVYRKSLEEAQARQVHAAMGPLVNRFADRAGADVLVFATLGGFLKSEGMQQKDGFFTFIGALLGSYRPAPIAAAVLEVGLVDGHSGELLWVDRFGAVFYQAIDVGFMLNPMLERFHGLHNRPEPASEETVPVEEVLGESAL